MALDTYASLLNLKIIVPSSKTNYVAIERFYWQGVFELRLSDVDIDEAWYLGQYPDVAAAIEKNVIKNARQHFCQSGYFEHRMPYRIDVDSEWYLATNPDVLEAVRKGTFSSPQEHFEMLGYKEGRHPHAGFALRKKGAVSAG